MATTIRSGAIFGIGVYGAANYGVSNVVYIPDGLSTSSSVGSVVVSAEANVDVVGVSGNSAVGSVVIVAKAVTIVSGVSSSISLGSVVVLENEVVDVVGVDVSSGVGIVSVTTTSFDYEAVKELYSRLRLVYVDGRHPRVVYTEQQPRIVYVEKIDAQRRRVYVEKDHRLVYTERRTTADERFALVEE